MSLKSRIRIMLSLVLLTGSLSLGVGWEAGAAPYPNECDAAHDGQTWTDPDTNITWRCRYVPGVGWRWVPVVVGDWALLSQRSTGHSFNRSGYNKGRGGGWAVSWLQTLQGYSSHDHLTRPPGYMANRILLYKWVNPSWIVCRDSDWYYNPVSAWGFKLRWSFGSTAPCAAGYYGSYGGQFFFRDDAWRGGWLWSGYRYISSQIPNSTEAAAEPEPTQPAPNMLAETPPLLPPADPLAVNPPPPDGLDIVTE